MLSSLNWSPWWLFVRSTNQETPHYDFFSVVILLYLFCPYMFLSTLFIDIVILYSSLNPLNAELNPICHFLILLGYLKFMGKCIVSISNKMERYTVYLYLEIALHVSGGTSTHHQERIQLYLQHLVFVTPLLLWVCCGWRTPPTAHSNPFQLFHYSGR
jgi:hypothetical protein